MYHLKPDKRTRTSARMISEALDKCLSEKQLNEITITDIQNKSGVGRATFYRIFDSLPDVLAYKCDNAFEEIIEDLRVLATTTTPEQLIIKYTDFWLKQDSLAEVIIRSNYTDILHTSNQKYMKELVHMLHEASSYSESQCDYLASILSAILITWIKKGKIETSEELVKKLNEIVMKLAYLLSTN